MYIFMYTYRDNSSWVAEDSGIEMESHRTEVPYKECRIRSVPKPQPLS